MIRRQVTDFKIENMSLFTTESPIAIQTTPAWKLIAGITDHTLLKPDATRAQVIQLCNEAAYYGCACAFVHQIWSSLAVSVLQGTGIKVGVPAGFPQGTVSTSVKRFEAAEAIKLGALEVDMVLNIGALKSDQRDIVQSDIAGVAEVVHAGGGILKVILETSLLTLDEKIAASQMAMVAGADFLKTSTGFAGGGATADDIRLMRGIVGEKLGVKASGGVRTASDAQLMVEAGANRLGTSATASILRELGAPEYTSHEFTGI